MAALPPHDRLRQRIVDALEEYEQTQRNYCAKVELDNPHIARAHWHAVWTFRKRVSEQLDVLVAQLRLARHVPPDD